MWKLLPILALPLVRAAIDIETTCFGPHGQIPCGNFEDDIDRAGGEWDCDIRAWTRAPDLIPGHSIPAETRLNMNGSACNDIVGWEVGMRMKERAIIKIKRDDVEFPKRPVRKPYNHTASEVDMGDMNDIYRGRYGSYYGHSGEDLEYEDAMEVYNEAIRNKSLFRVDGRERVMFDEKLTMDLPTYDGEESVNHIRAFSIDVPLTNFPPMKAYEGNGASSGKDEQMLNTETMFEYYHHLTLSNGTVLDVPAGRAGFLTEPSPTSLSKEIETKWPVVVPLDSPRKVNETIDKVNDYMGMGGYNQGPECDAGNKAEFEMTVSTNTKNILPEHNITLSIHLTRKGNGTEYPSFLDLSLTTYQNQSFAYSYPQINSKLDYSNLIREDDDYMPGGVDTSYPQKMLLVQSQESLERRKRNEEERHGMVSYSSSGGRWPVQRGSVRYDFEEDGGVGKEEYDFEVEFPIPYNAYPNFETVFTTLTPQLSFTLQTTFLCSKTPASEGEGDQNEDETLDAKWEEWKLPAKKQSSSSPFGSMGSYGLNHRGYTPLVIHRESNLSVDQQSRLKHYLDPTALAPALSESILSHITPLKSSAQLNLVGHENIVEEESELKQSRYDLYSSGRGYQPRCMRVQFRDRVCRNNGGGGMHAAKLWQRMEEERKGGVVVDTVKAKEVEGQTFYRIPAAARRHV